MRRSSRRMFQKQMEAPRHSGIHREVRRNRKDGNPDRRSVRIQTCEGRSDPFDRADAVRRRGRSGRIRDRTGRHGAADDPPASGRHDREDAGHRTAVHPASADRTRRKADDRTADQRAASADAARQHSGTRSDAAEGSGAQIPSEGDGRRQVHPEDGRRPRIRDAEVSGMRGHPEEGNPEGEGRDRPAGISGTDRAGRASDHRRVHRRLAVQFRDVLRDPRPVRTGNHTAREEDPVRDPRRHLHG